MGGEPPRGPSPRTVHGIQHIAGEPETVDDFVVLDVHETKRLVKGTGRPILSAGCDNEPRTNGEYRLDQRAPDASPVHDRRNDESIDTDV